MKNIMKKMLFFAALASVAFASCTSDESVFNGAKESKEIKFQSAIYASQTRAEHDPTLTPVENFRVAAWLEGKDAFYIREEMTPAGAFVSNNTYYWPTDGSGLDVAAVSPATAVNDYVFVTRSAGTAVTDFKFTSANPNPNTTNLMFADYVKGQKADENSTVTLLFRHALANLHVNVEQALQEDNGQKLSWEVKINSLTVKNIKNIGEFQVGWDFNATTEDYYWNNLDGNFTWNLVTAPTTIKYSKFTSPGNHYIVPQQFDAAAPIAIVINYDIITTYSLNGQTTTVNYDKEVDLSTLKYTTAAGSNQTLEGFAMNKDITINVKINPSETLTPITFTVQEEEWGTVSSDPVINVE